jgi:hypothetical protein
MREKKRKEFLKYLLLNSQLDYTGIHCVCKNEHEVVVGAEKGILEVWTELT